MKMEELYKVSIYNEDGSDLHKICVCAKDQIYHIIRCYENLHTTLVDMADKLNIEYGLTSMTEDPTLMYWDQGHIIAENLKTGERFNYVEVQGGFGLEPLGGKE